MFAHPYRYLVAFLLTGLIVWAGLYGFRVIAIGAAYKAKLLCSNTFFASRDADVVLHQDLGGAERIIRTNVDYELKSVIASFPGVAEQKAIFVEHLGCILLAGAPEYEVRRRAAEWGSFKTRYGGRVVTAVATETSIIQEETPSMRVSSAIDRYFSESDLADSLSTRAIVVIHDGHIVSERYAPGFSETTPLLGWSMTKSVINTLVGILVREGKLSVDSPVTLPEWSGARDPRAKITLDQLLRMSSGLEFDERSGPLVSDVNVMLLQQPDAAAYAIKKPLIYPPDTVWDYSSGTTNIISRIIRDRLGGQTEDVLSFINEKLFGPLGIERAVIELDSRGNLLGSSFMYATAREWSRFGELYLHGGVWNGERILPEGWVHYSAKPTSTDPGGRYGAHFWTNGDSVSEKGSRPHPKLPPDMFYASGYKGQRIVILPSKKVVIARFGWSIRFGSKHMEQLVSDVLAAL